MEDNEIISLLFERSELAVSAIRSKYGQMISKTVSNILHNTLDAEECVDDTLMRLWNTIPPQKPRFLKAYICRTARNAALNRYESDNAQKRNSRYDTSFEELEEVLSHSDGPGARAEAKEIAAYVSSFLKEQSYNDRYIFMRYHWYGDSVSQIAADTGLAAKAVSVRLFRTRKRLKKYLEKTEVI